MDLARTINGKKFMWDDKAYRDEPEAAETRNKYLADGFETETVEEDNQYFLFTRRVVKEAKVEGSPT